MEIKDATGNNAWILDYISSRNGEDVFQKDLEIQFGITRSTASKVVSLMVKKGLVKRQGIPGDARLKKMILTDRARQILDLMEEEFQRTVEILTEGFTDSELDQFYHYISRMQNNIRKNMQKTE